MEHSPTTCVHPLSCTFLLLSRAPGAASVLSPVCEVPTLGAAAGTPVPSPQSASRLSSPGKAGAAVPFCFSFWRISSGCASSSIFPKNECPHRELCHLTHPAEGACTLMPLVPPVLQTRFQNKILGSSASWSLCPPLLPGTDALTISSCEGQLLIWGVKQGANSNQPLGPRTGGEAEAALPSSSLRVLRAQSPALW